MRALAVTFPALCAGLLLAAACGSRTTEVAPTPDGAPVGAVAQLDDARYLGAAFDVGNLRVWPVHTTAALDVGEFLTLQEAQEIGTAEVREIGGGQVNGNRAQQRGRGGVQIDIPLQSGGIAQTEEQVAQVVDLVNSGGAQVGSLVIENKGDLPLLVCAGTIVKGGNQDRQIGQDIVVAAGQTVPVDAFCVEAGRWTNVREGVANDGQFVALKTMTAKNVRAKGQYEDDQGGVWEEVAAVRTRSLSPAVGAAAGSGGSARARLASGTTFVDALEKVDDATREAREASVAAIVARFDELAESDSAPVGFAYAVNGEAQGLRVFAHERLLRQNLETFASTIVVEAEVAGDAAHDPCDAEAVVAMVSAIEKDAQQKREQTQASNVNVIYSNRYGFNGNCYVKDADGKEIPVTQDWTKK